MIYKDIAQWDDVSTGVNYTRAVVEVYKDDQLLTELHPRTDYYYDAQQNMTIPGVRSTLADDVYILLVDWEPASAIGATFKLYVNPLVNWLWIGCLAFLLGVIIAAWPEKEPEHETGRMSGGDRARSAPQTENVKRKTRSLREVKAQLRYYVFCFAHRSHGTSGRARFWRRDSPRRMTMSTRWPSSCTVPSAKTPRWMSARRRPVPSGATSSA